MNAAEIIGQAAKLIKADGWVIIIEDSQRVNVRWAGNTTTTNGLSKDKVYHLIAIKDQRVGIASRSALEGDAVGGWVKEAEDRTAQALPAPDYMPLVDGTADPGWETEPAELAPGVFNPIRDDLAATLRQAEAESIKLFGYAEHDQTTTYLATSTGIRRRQVQRNGQIEINAKSPDFQRSVWQGQASIDFTDVDLKAIYASLKQRLEWSKTRLDLPAGRYETILQPSAVADLLIYAYWSSSARDADEGRTVFSKPGGGNKTGQKLFSADVNLYSDPAEPGLEVTPFEVVGGSGSWASVFDNGASLQRTDWIKEGKINQLITTRHWAKQSQSKPAGLINNLIFPSAGAGLDAMIKSTKRGLLVTCLWYIREVDPQTLLLTGLTRDGVFLIEDGEVKGAVNNFRFNMSPLDVLAQATEIGQSVPTLAREWGDYFTFAKMPPVRVKDFNMSSVSQAT